MHIPTSNVRFDSLNELKTKTKIKKWKMRIKRALLFLIALTLMGSVYYFYSLHYKPSNVYDEVWENDLVQVPHKNKIRINVEDRLKSADSSKTLSSPKDKHRLFPFGVGKFRPNPAPQQNNNQALEEDLIETTPSHGLFGRFRQSNDAIKGNSDIDRRFTDAVMDDGESETDNGVGETESMSEKKEHSQQEALAKRVEEQQKLLEQQAQVLQQLQAKLLDNSIQQQHESQEQLLQNPQQQRDFQQQQQQQIQHDFQPQLSQQRQQLQQPQLNTHLSTQRALDRSKEPQSQLRKAFQGIGLKQQTEDNEKAVDHKNRIGIATSSPREAAHVQAAQLRDATKGRKVTDARNAPVGENLPAIEIDQNALVSQEKKNGATSSDDKSGPELLDAETLFKRAREKGLKKLELARKMKTFGLHRTSTPPFIGVRMRELPDGKRVALPGNRNTDPAQESRHEAQAGFGEDDAAAAGGLDIQDHRGSAFEKSDNSDPSDVDNKQPILLSLRNPDAGLGSSRTNVRQGDREGNSLVQVHVYDMAQEPEGAFTCVPLLFAELSRPVCLHHERTNTKQSARLLRNGTWEARELDLITQTLQNDSSLALVDLGAGLGVYTVAAVAKGRRVLAVEPCRENVLLIHKTLLLNNGTNHVTLVTDALGEHPGYGRLLPPFPVGNSGAVYVRPLSRETELGDDVTADGKNLVQIVRLNDLLPLTSFPRALMKLDVQGDENLVLRGGEIFFRRTDIPYVFMHWLPTQNHAASLEVSAFFQRLGYEAAKSPSGKTLTQSELNEDIDFVVWRKTKAPLQSQIVGLG